jgi:hypothetical protein
MKAKIKQDTKTKLKAKQKLRLQNITKIIILINEKKMDFKTE